MIKTGRELAAASADAAKNYKTLYIMGCFGAPMNAKNKKRYSTNYAYNKKEARTKKILAASADTFGFDCVCFIKGLLWGWDGNTSKTYGGAVYRSNGVPDIGANQMIEVCKDISTDFSDIQVGEVVWMKGHIGVYIGDGLVAEASPKWKDGAQITAVLNIGKKEGYNGRTWTKHGKLPYVTYEEPQPEPEPKPTKPTDIDPTVPKIGDTVDFTGTKHYVNPNADSGPSCKPGKARVTNIASPGKDRHPYHLIAVQGGGSTVYGWVDKKDIVKSTEPWVPAVGDLVNFTGTKHYTNAYTTTGPSCKPGKAKITKIYKPGKSRHPYHLVAVKGGGSDVYGWVDADTISKA